MISNASQCVTGAAIFFFPLGPLCATGVTMSVILDLSYTVSIWISAAVAITYTLLGGLYSVAYTDIIQLVLIFISLVSTCSGFRDWRYRRWLPSGCLLGSEKQLGNRAERYQPGWLRARRVKCHSTRWNDT